MSNLPKRDWFQPGEGIAREVISADIQRYLGRDATVRPGYGQGDEEGVQGYWINAHRQLTTAQVEDLKRDSQSWHAERSSRDISYTSSNTFAYSKQQQQHQHQHHAEPQRSDYSHPPAQSSYPSYPQYQQSETQPAYSYQQTPAASGYYQGNTWVQTPGYTQTPAAAAPRSSAPYTYPAPTNPGYPQQAASASYGQYAYPQSAGYPQQAPAGSSSAYSHGQQPSTTSQHYQDPRAAQSSTQYPYGQQQQGHQSYSGQAYGQYQQQQPPSSRRR